MKDMQFNCEITISDIISLLGLVIGVWIARNVQQKLNTTSSIKEFHIDELKSIRNAYSTFFNELHRNKRSAVDIKDWLKVMTTRITTFETSIANYYKIKDPMQLKSLHSQFQIYITGTEDFNDNYREPVVTLSTATRDEIFKRYGEFTSYTVNLAIRIHSANKKFIFFWKKD